eukprot:gene12391-15584_t
MGVREGQIPSCMFTSPKGKLSVHGKTEYKSASTAHSQPGGSWGLPAVRDRRRNVKSDSTCTPSPPIGTNAKMNKGQFKGYTVMDGGITMMMPLPQGPKHVVKISCMPIEAIQRLKFPNKVHALSNIQIGMGVNSPWDVSIDDTFK